MPTTQSDTSRHQTKALIALLSIVFVALLALVISLGLRWRPRPATTPTPTVGPATEPPTAEPTIPDLGATADADATPLTLPPLQQSDDVVRRLVQELSSHPDVAQWLVTDDLIRTFVVVVDNIGEGVSPRVHLKHMAPKERFQIADDGAILTPTPATYARYERQVEIFLSLDPRGCARLYHQMKPLLQEAYRELGYPDKSIDRSVSRALHVLLDTPLPHDPVALVPQGLIYRYADPRLEGLTLAQKHLLRLGPRNQRRVQEHLRLIADALGL